MTHSTKSAEILVAIRCAFGVFHEYMQSQMTGFSPMADQVMLFQRIRQNAIKHMDGFCPKKKPS